MDIYDHVDPKEWTTLAEYKKAQSASDYRPELDLCTVPEYRWDGTGPGSYKAEHK